MSSSTNKMNKVVGDYVRNIKMILSSKVLYLDALKHIISQNSSYINEPRFQGQSLLQVMIFHPSGTDDIISFLIDHGADVNLPSYNGYILIQALSSCRHRPKIVKVLLESGAIVKDERGGDSALSTAVLCGYGTDILRMLTDRRADPNHINRYSQSVLCVAISTNQELEVVEFLVDAGATVAACQMHSSALHCILSGNPIRSDIVRYMLQTTSRDKVVIDDSNRSVINNALKNSVYETGAMKCLIVPQFVDVNARNAKDSTMLHDALWNPHCTLGVIKHLIDLHARVDSVDWEGETPLHKAVLTRPCDPEIVRVLLKYGSPVNVANRLGETVLHIAVKKRQDMDILRLLLNSGERVGQPQFSVFQRDRQTSKEVVQTIRQLLIAIAVTIHQLSMPFSQRVHQRSLSIAHRTNQFSISSSQRIQHSSVSVAQRGTRIPMSVSQRGQQTSMHVSQVFIQPQTSVSHRVQHSSVAQKGKQIPMSVSEISQQTSMHISQGYSQPSTSVSQRLQKPSMSETQRYSQPSMSVSQRGDQPLMSVPQRYNQPSMSVSQKTRQPSLSVPQRNIQPPMSVSQKNRQPSTTNARRFDLPLPPILSDALQQFAFEKNLENLTRVLLLLKYLVLEYPTINICNMIVQCSEVWGDLVFWLKYWFSCLTEIVQMALKRTSDGQELLNILRYNGAEPRRNLYDVLSDPNSNYLLKILRNVNDFPYYSEIIAAKIGSEFLKEVFSDIRACIKYSKFRNDKVTLNSDCVRDIGEFLSHNDLVNMILVFHRNYRQL